MMRFAFRAFRGLDTVSDPESVAYDRRSGACALAVATDVEILDGGRRLARRPGRVKAAGGHWRDGWNAPDGTAYAVVDNVLCEVRPGPATRDLAILATTGPVRFAALADLVFWDNGVEAGLIQDGQAVAWGGKLFPVASEAGRHASPAPGGGVLAGFAGRVWWAAGRDLRYTAGAGRWHFYKTGAGSIPMPADIAMLRPVDNGLYVGTALGVYFLAGTDPIKGMPRLLASPEPVTAVGSDVAVRADALSSRIPPAAACLWTSRSGIHGGLADGVVLNLTHSQVAMDAPALRAAAVWLPSTRRYVVVLHP